MCTIDGFAVFAYGAGEQQKAAHVNTQPESAEAAGEDGVRKSVMRSPEEALAAQAEESSESDSESEDEPPRSGTSGWMAFPEPGDPGGESDSAASARTLC